MIRNFNETCMQRTAHIIHILAEFHLYGCLNIWQSYTISSTKPRDVGIFKDVVWCHNLQAKLLLTDS